MLPADIEDYIRPNSLPEALEHASKYQEGEAIFLAGGQSAMQAIKTRILRPRCIIDLQNISDLKEVAIGKNSTEFGSMTRYVEIAQKIALPPALAALKDACEHVGDRQVRNRGTLGGSICWNFLASCVPTVFLTLNGMVTLKSTKAERNVAATNFFIGPLETVREDDELLTKITIPNPKRTASAYQKWGLVKDALPVIGVAVSITVDKKGNCEKLTMGVAGLPAGCQLVSGLDQLQDWTGEVDPLDQALNQVASDLEVHSDLSASEAYRRHLITKIGRTVCLSARNRALELL